MRLYSTLGGRIVFCMRYLKGTWVRGGTSKCWLFDAADLAGGDPDAVLAAASGAGDPRQADRVGGATSTTFKAALVQRSANRAARRIAMAEISVPLSEETTLAS